MVRVAVLLTGHLRCYDKCIQSFRKNFLELNQADGCEIDLFIVTYRQRENEKWKPDIRKGHIDLNDVQKTYQPYLKKIEVLDDTKFQYQYPFRVPEQLNKNIPAIRNYIAERYYAAGDLNRLMTTGKLIQMGAHMVKQYAIDNNISYDYWLKFRSDINLDTPLKITELEWERFDLFVPDKESGGAKTHRFCDWLFFGRFETVFQVLNYVDQMSVFDQYNLIDVSFIESHILLYIQSHHIKMDRIPIGLTRVRMD